MTGPEFLAARTTLGLTQGSLATALGIGRRTIQQYEADDRAVPETIARVMRAAQADRTILDRIAAA